MAQYQTIYRQDYLLPVCKAEYKDFRGDYTAVEPEPWKTEPFIIPEILPKVYKQKSKRFPPPFIPPAKCPMCHPVIRVFDRSITSYTEKPLPEIADFKFELGQKRRIEIKWKKTEYKDTIHRFGTKIMKGLVRIHHKKWYGRKKSELISRL